MLDYPQMQIHGLLFEDNSQISCLQNLALNITLLAMGTIVTYWPVSSPCSSDILEQLKIHISHNLYSSIISLKDWNEIMMPKFAFEVLD